MVNPVLLRTTKNNTSHHYEESTAINLQKRLLDPISRDLFQGYIIDRELKAAIECWVNEQVVLLNKERNVFSFAKTLEKIGKFAIKNEKSDSHQEEKNFLRRSI